MRILTITLVLTAFFIQGCSLFKKSESSDQKKGIDQSTLKPLEYSTSDRNLDYVTKYNRAAILEMERIGVPASITLAQGIIESAAGTSDLAQQANNHFGIKCGGNWDGKTYYKQDDDRDEQGNIKESCFRKYESVEESFLDHGEFLRDPRKATRYGYLFNLDRTDYKAWARGLQSAGYATSSDYADKLINMIERYKLYEYDHPGTVTNNTFPGTPGGGPNGGVKPEGPNAPGTPASSSGRIGRVNDIKVVASREGETVADIARAFRISPDKVVDFNDRGYPPGLILKPNTRIFIQCKKDQWSGRATEHIVREGQTMFDIAQIYGIKLDKLLERNGLARGQEPEVNEKIRIKRSKAPLKPIKLRDTTNDPTTTPAAPSQPQKDGTLINGDDLDFDISPGAPPKDSKPANPSPAVKPPAVSNEPFPGDSKPGQVDPTPAKPSAPTVDDQPVPLGYHRVVKGDTLYSLSKKYNTTVTKLKTLNNLSDDGIKIGQVIRVE